MTFTNYQFKIKHLGRDGVTKNDTIDDFLALSYRRAVNKPGRLELRFNVDSKVFDSLEDFDLFEVYWKNDLLGVPWHPDFEAIFRDITYNTDENGISYATLSCPGQMHILSFRQISWPAGITNRSKFAATPAETLAKTIVNYNCTSVATVANGRIREGNLATGMGMTIVSATDQARGNNIDKSFANGNLLRILSDDIAPVAGGDFSFVRTPAGGVNARWVFEFHPGQLGEDKSSGSNLVEFSLARANMMNPELSISRSEESTAIIAGGQGMGQNRQYSVALGANYAADNDIEDFSSYTNQSTTASLTTSAEVRAIEVQSYEELTFDVIQTQAVFYSPVAVAGRATYDLGDLVRAVYAGRTFIRKITAIEVRFTLDQNPVQIDVEVSNFNYA